MKSIICLRYFYGRYFRYRTCWPVNEGRWRQTSLTSFLPQGHPFLLQSPDRLSVLLLGFVITDEGLAGHSSTSHLLCFAIWCSLYWESSEDANLRVFVSLYVLNMLSRFNIHIKECNKDLTATSLQHFKSIFKIVASRPQVHNLSMFGVTIFTFKFSLRPLIQIIAIGGRKRYFTCVS